MDIGNKIKQSRIEAKITQEKAAEALGVSRQTISNWENEKTYPDIISVLKMSDLYHVSLDYLLKGETTMNNYMDYLEESTNTVKSRNRFTKLILVFSYLIIWAIAILVFWCFTSGSDAMGYSLVFLWIILPVTTFADSLFLSLNNCWGKAKWYAPLFFGIMYMLAEYATFSLANNIAFDKLNMPHFSMILAGALISLAGIAAGHYFYTKKSRRKESE